MANQIGLRIHTRPGDEVLCEDWAHIFRYEGGATAALNGVTCRTFAGPRGILDVADFEGQIHPDVTHLTRTRLVSLENTHNRGGGSIYPIGNVERICRWAHENGLATHLDGARLMNAVVKTGVPADRWASHFDTVSICFSKGLGAPVGSAITGSREFMREARRARKLFGGGMRQAGVLAAACLYALDHNMTRLAEDHDHAQILATALERTGKFLIRANEVETNLLWVGVDPSLGSPSDVVARFRERGILIGAYGSDTVRFCTHLDVSRADINDVVKQIALIGGQ